MDNWPRYLSLVADREGCPFFPIGNILGVIIGLSRHAIGDKTFADLRYQSLDIGIIQTQYRYSVKRYFVDKINKSTFNFVQVTIKIEMIRIDIGHHSDGRGQLSKRNRPIHRLPPPGISPVQAWRWNRWNQGVRLSPP